MFLGNIFWFADKERFWQSGNHKEQRTGFKTVFFLVFPTRGEFFYARREKEGEKEEKPRREKSHSTPRTQTSIIGAHTHAARARAKEEEEKFYA